METDPIKRLAARLTRAQYEVMVSKMFRWEISAHPGTARVLVRMGLIERGKDFEFFETYKFTSLGKRVRAELMSQKYDKPIEEWSWE